MTTPANHSVLELHGVTKRFGSVPVLRSVDFDLIEGEVHGLVGENGAGKSTLTKLLAGVDDHYDGELRIRGRAVRLRSPADAQGFGIGMVHQELSVFPQLTVAENLFGRNSPCRMGLVDWKRMAREAQQHLTELGVEIDVTRRMSELPVGSQQVVEIARVVFSGAKVIMLDEPTSALSAPEIARLFELVRTLKAQGKSILFISHFLEDVLAISDRVTVLKDGAKVKTLRAADSTKETLVELMLGHGETIRVGDNRRSTAQKEAALVVKDFTLHKQFESVSFTLHRGEVLGLFGYMGAGQVELGRCLFGASRANSGTAALEGKQLQLSNTTAAVAHGIAFVPENRRHSLMLQKPVYANITLVHLKKIVGWLLNRNAETAVATRSIAALAIRPPDPSMQVGALSGGNQQKVVIAKWLVEQPRLLILIEPTRGIDIAAKEEVMNVVDKLRSEGVPVLLISSEPEVIERAAQRAFVMKKGKICAELRGHEISRQSLMQHA